MCPENHQGSFTLYEQTITKFSNYQTKISNEIKRISQPTDCLTNSWKTILTIYCNYTLHVHLATGGASPLFSLHVHFCSVPITMTMLKFNQFWIYRSIYITNVRKRIRATVF